MVIPFSDLKTVLCYKYMALRCQIKNNFLGGKRKEQVTLKKIESKLYNSKQGSEDPLLP